MSARIRILMVAAVVAMVSACSHTPAPVEDLSAPQALSKDGTYRVGRGDTLYSIAFHYGLDWKDVARWNNIDRPYTIWPGQDLRLKPPETSRSSDTTTIVTRAAGRTPRATTRPANIPAPATTQDRRGGGRDDRACGPGRSGGGSARAHPALGSNIHPMIHHRPPSQNSVMLFTPVANGSPPGVRAEA